MDARRIIRGLALAALASVLIYALLAAFTDAPAVLSALRGFPLATFLLMLALGLVSFAARAVRWRRLMQIVVHPVSFRDAFYLQLAGQTMTLTPGRVGEVFKPWIAGEISGLPMTRGIALVFAERVADLIAVCILSLGGLALLGGGQWALAAGLVAIAAGTALASSEWFHRLALRTIEKQRWARKHHASAAAISETIRASLTWRTLLWSVGASILAWGLEGVGFALCLHALGFDALGVLAAISVYAVSTIVGAFTFLPGGIGLTEASMAGILIAAGMLPPAASAATLIVRVATLWWGMAVGVAMLASRPSLLRAMLAGSGDRIDA